MSNLTRIRIVLNRPSHPGNIGATARAMKNMGLSKLTLVSPKEFPSSHATALASGADDILASAEVVDSVEEALTGTALVIGTSARARSLSWPVLTLEDTCLKINEYVDSHSADVAILFGTENYGLTNDELHLCDHHLMIDTNPEYSSLNLAQAVLLICYECRKQIAEKASVPQESEAEYAEFQDMHRFYEHLENTLKHIGFLNPNQPKQLMSRLKRLFLRAKLDKIELNIMRGILSTVDKRTR